MKRKQRPSKSKPPSSGSFRGRVAVKVFGVAAIATGIFVALHFWNRERGQDNQKHGVTAATVRSTAPTPRMSRPAKRQGAKPQYYTIMALDEQPRIYQWFGGVPEMIRRTSLDPGGQSNIRHADYAGAESCQECHKANYAKWSKHPHGHMNAWATDQNVRGDFSGAARIEYMGGTGTFYRQDGRFRMRLAREQVRIYDIRRTIGSRFFQYYIGKLIEGPEGDDHPTRRIDHVMPFGYWFEAEEWVPIVNVGDGEKPDEQRDDPFTVQDKHPYDRNCSNCHVTRPTGDAMLFAGFMRRLDAYSPRPIHFATEDYLRETHPDLAETLGRNPQLTEQQMVNTLTTAMNLPAKQHAVTLGISCEACHNGCANHVENEEVLPSFFPRSPHVVVAGESPHEVWSRNDTNVNWICSRCHTGGRKRYAAGISTWNSTELSDAARGSCYDPVAAKQHGMNHLTCVHCHDPHEGIGQQWSRTRAEDNASCTDCHSQFKQRDVLTAHTHHQAESSGSDCMNCHMPHFNEGLQDMVRTHTIFSPTEPKMIEANQPNACNHCHVDQNIDWTLRHLKDWYGADGYDQAKIDANYRDRRQPAAVGWLTSPHHGTRLVGSDALTRAGADWALTDIIKLLDDPYLINRQFTARGLEAMLKTDLCDFGYRFYMFSQERAQPIQRIRDTFESDTQ